MDLVWLGQGRLGLAELELEGDGRWVCIGRREDRYFMARLELTKWQVSEKQIEAIAKAGLDVIYPLKEDVGLIERTCYDSCYEGLIATVVSQQLSDKAAQAIINKLPQYFFDDPKLLIENIQKHHDLMAKSNDRLIPLSNSKLHTLNDIAKQFDLRILSESLLKNMDCASRANTLSAIKGIGPWSINMVEIFVFKNHNIFPTTDKGVIDAIMLLKGCDRAELSKTRLEALMSYFNSWSRKSNMATIFTFYLWALNGLDKGKKDFYRSYYSHIF